MNYRKETTKSFEKVLEDVQSKVAENGFRVLCIHDVQQTLSEKGFEIDNYSIVEVCSAKHANCVIGVNKEYGVLMPCKINIYSEEGKTVIITPEPLLMVRKFEMKGVEDIVYEIDNVLKKVIDESV